MNAKQEISALIRAADGGTATALLRLAEIVDEHMRDCPHVAPPVARAPWALRTIGGYAPTSHDEQVMVDRAADQAATIHAHVADAYRAGARALDDADTYYERSRYDEHP